MMLESQAFPEKPKPQHIPLENEVSAPFFDVPRPYDAFFLDQSFPKHPFLDPSSHSPLENILSDCFFQEKRGPSVCTESLSEDALTSAVPLPYNIRNTETMVAFDCEAQRPATCAALSFEQCSFPQKRSVSDQASYETYIAFDDTKEVIKSRLSAEISQTAFPKELSPSKQEHFEGRTLDTLVAFSGEEGMREELSNKQNIESTAFPSQPYLTSKVTCEKKSLLDTEGGLPPLRYLLLSSSSIPTLPKNAHIKETCVSENMLLIGSSNKQGDVIFPVEQISFPCATFLSSSKASISCTNSLDLADLPSLERQSDPVEHSTGFFTQASSSSMSVCQTSLQSVISSQEPQEEKQSIIGEQFSTLPPTSSSTNSIEVQHTSLLSEEAKETSACAPKVLFEQLSTIPEPSPQASRVEISQVSLMSQPIAAQEQKDVQLVSEESPVSEKADTAPQDGTQQVVSGPVPSHSHILTKSIRTFVAKSAAELLPSSTETELPMPGEDEEPGSQVAQDK